MPVIGALLLVCTVYSSWGLLLEFVHVVVARCAGKRVGMSCVVRSQRFGILELACVCHPAGAFISNYTLLRLDWYP